MNGKSTANDLYERLMDINQEAFEAKLFDAAYHALASALACADEIGDAQLFLKVSSKAKNQASFIDKNFPKYRHSTQSAEERGQLQSIFSTLANQAHVKATMSSRNEDFN